jgi:hypothetical protein
MGSNTLNFSTTDNANTLFINSNGRIGIGTASPSQLLHLSGSSGSSIFVETPSAFNANLYLGSTSNNIRSNSAGVIDILSAGSLTFFPSGSTTSPTMRLSAANSQGRLLLISPSAGGAFTDNLYRLQIYPQSPDSGGLLVSGKTAIGTTPSQASAILEVNSTSQGILPPRMTTAQRNAISAPAQGLQVYDTDLLTTQVFNGTNWQGVIIPNINSNVLIGTTTDSGFRLDVSGSGVSGSVRFQNDLTVTGSMNITGSLVVSGSITNVLPSGPTWFTSDIVNSSTVTFHTATPTANNYFIRSDSSSTLLNGSNNVIFRIGNSTRAQIFNNGNFLIQNEISQNLKFLIFIAH